jgi:hypothetical protein
MNIDSNLVRDASFVSTIEAPSSASDVKRKPHNVWRRERGGSSAEAIAEATILLVSGLLTAVAFAPVFTG